MFENIVTIITKVLTSMKAISTDPVVTELRENAGEILTDVMDIVNTTEKTGLEEHLTDMMLLIGKVLQRMQGSQRGIAKPMAECETAAEVADAILSQAGQ